MKQTPNYNLNKLEGPDTADLTQFNPNWDSLDANIKQLSDDHVAHKAETVTDPAPPHGMGSAASKTAQESATDAVAGRLMQVGAFGLGHQGIDIPSGDCNLISANGFYRLLQGTINAFPGKLSGDSLIHASWSSTYALQIGGSRANKMWVRYNVNGTWQPWIEVITSAGGKITGDLTVDKLAIESLTRLVVRMWNHLTDADIDALIPGTIAGSILEGPVSGHLVIGIRSNDGSDGFYIIDTGTDSSGDYINVMLAVNSGILQYKGNNIWHEGNFCGSSAWNGSHLTMGNHHFWVDSSGRLRVKNGAPTSDSDGAVVGTQT